jgi:hypothetical protein
MGKVELSGRRDLDNIYRHRISFYKLAGFMRASLPAMFVARAEDDPVSQSSCGNVAGRLQLPHFPGSAYYERQHISVRAGGQKCTDHSYRVWILAVGGMTGAIMHSRSEPLAPRGMPLFFR